MSEISKIAKLFLSFSLISILVACNGKTSPNSSITSPDDQSTAVTETQKKNGKSEESSEGEKVRAEFKDNLSGPKLLSSLQKGGHIIYFRHTKTNKNEKDQVASNNDLENCEIQRNLSEEGIKQAKNIGAAFTAKNIPVGEVITSEYCRTWKTADLAFGKYVKNSNLNYMPSKEPTNEQLKDAETRIKPLLNQIPKGENNTIIVGHSDMFKVATGILPEPEGIAYILTPNDKGNFELQANVLPEEWSNL